jgi:TfoX/Sxy family transcriptional regulator of competence genes
MKARDNCAALAERIRSVLPPGHASEKRMFGGTTFLVNGNMLCCAFERGLMLRVGKNAEADALSEPNVRPLSKTRKVGGFVFIELPGLTGKAALSRWIGKARAHVEALPPKKHKNSPRRG